MTINEVRDMGYDVTETRDGYVIEGDGGYVILELVEGGVHVIDMVDDWETDSVESALDILFGGLR
jgi:hypothetical protein